MLVAKNVVVRMSDGTLGHAIAHKVRLQAQSPPRFSTSVCCLDQPVLSSLLPRLVKRLELSTQDLYIARFKHNDRSSHLDISQHELYTHAHIGVESINASKVQGIDLQSVRILQQQFERAFTLRRCSSLIVLWLDYSYDLTSFCHLSALSCLDSFDLRPAGLANIFNIQYLTSNWSIEGARLNCASQYVCWE